MTDPKPRQSVIDRLNDDFKARLRRVVRQSLKLDAITEALVPANHDDLDNPAHLARTSIIFGVWLMVLVFGVFGIWSIIAKIDSAAIAPGKVVVNSNRKVIDHLEGGIVEEIMVKNGDMVEKGQPLLKLREISAKARVQLLKDKYYTDLAMETRLVAERDKKETVEFPEELTKATDSKDLAEIMDTQKRLFDTRTQNIRGQVDILKTRILKHEQEIKGLDMQARSMEDQIKYLNEEIAVVEELLKKGNAVRPRLLNLKRQAAELQGRQGEYLAQKAKAQEDIDETNLTILNTESEYLNKVVEELKQTQVELADLRERLSAGEDVLERIVIRAPEKGVVNDLMVHTVGSTVQPSQKILEIIPIDDKLIVEAQVSPMDIDVVRPGLEARVRLTAYKTRQVPPIDGKVVFVSADQLVDEREGHPYFQARVEIDASELAELGSKIELYPGMPAETLIITGSRTFFAYMMDPITQSFRHSFRQQ